MKHFINISFDHAHIQEVNRINSQLVLTYLDWQSQVKHVYFQNVLGYEAFFVKGEEIKECFEEKNNSLIRRACAIADEQPSRYTYYGVTSSTEHDVILGVVASSFSVE